MPLDKIIAVVDEEIILQSDLQEALAQMQNQPGFSSLNEQAQRSKVLNQLIDNKVLLAIARTDTNIVVTEAEVERTVQMQLERQEENSGGKYRFAETLKQYYGMTVEDFRQQMMKNMEEQSLIQKLQLKYVGDVEPSNKQVRDFYEEYQDSLPTLYNNVKLSLLSMSVKPNRKLELEAYKTCDSLIQLLNNGTDFDKLLQEVSGSSIQGGDLGYIKRGSLDPDYERAAFRLNVGDYSSQPIRTKFGFHIIQSTGKRDSEIRTSHIVVFLQPSKKDTLRTIQFLDSLRLVALEHPTGQNSFASIASRFSEDKETRNLGGLLGWSTLQNVRPSYRNIVDTLSAGNITPPTWLDDKLSLFKMDDRSESRTLNLEDDWKQIRLIARNYASEKKLQGYLEDWRKKVYIENYSRIHTQGQPLIFSR